MSGCHGLGLEASQGLGEAALGALLLAAGSKPGEKINLRVQGSGRHRYALVDATPEGTVRGTYHELDVSRSGELDPEKGPWGGGFLSVLRTKLGESQPYIGTVPLATGHLAKDLAFYWAQSEQIPTAVGLFVRTEKGAIGSAMAFLVQALPGASPEEILHIERQVVELGELDGNSVGANEPIEVLARIFQHTGFSVLEETPVRFHCSCTSERVERALALVGADELQAILKEDGSASVKCDFCSKTYEIGKETLQRLLKETKGG